MMRVGILAVQGAFAEHAASVEKLGAAYVLLRKPEDAAGIDCLILPGGESTTQRKLLHDTGLFAPLQEKIQAGIPVLATCAGLILLSKEVSGGEGCFSVLPVRVQRNAYGRQLGSFSAVGDVGDISGYPMRFIRAPYVTEVLSDAVQVLNKTDGRITAVRYQNLTALSFHPELTDDLRIHREFLRL